MPFGLRFGLRLSAMPEAGRPLYASLGFEAIAELSAWILETPPQG